MTHDERSIPGETADTRPVQARIPDPVRAVLCVELEQLATRPLPVFALLTTLPTGWPHIAYLGPGELLDIDAHALGLATWGNSNSTAAAIRTGKVTLQTVLDGVPHLLRLQVEDHGDIVVADRALRALRATVVDASSDAVPYATLTTGTMFEVHDRTAALARWQATRAALGRALNPSRHGRPTS